MDSEKKALDLRVGRDGASGIEVHDPAGKLFSRLGTMPKGGLGTYVGTKDGKLGFALIGSEANSVLQMGDLTGAKLVEVHALAESALPADARAKAPPASLVLFDRKGKDAFRVPAPK